MYCSKCGKESETNAKFCAACGAPLGAAETGSKQMTNPQRAFGKHTAAMIVSSLITPVILLLRLFIQQTPSQYGWGIYSRSPYVPDESKPIMVLLALMMSGAAIFLSLRDKETVKPKRYMPVIISVVSFLITMIIISA